MISNTAYDCINIANDSILYWKRLIKKDVVLTTIDPIYEYTANLKDLYRYIAWVDTAMTESDNY